MNNCEHCKHYVQHYRFENNLGIRSVCCGHCLKYGKLKRNCADYIKGNNEFRRTKKYTAIECLINLENKLTQLQKSLKEIKPKISN